ncbi:hypothetical protein H0H81_012262 [Sphagnurus paluster]|uniref:Probable cytosolic iron-sulfur protein assembly protein 1 n=1 Tax=Sphagnurus paluster TaxID=117069 RepID=A0A9P7GNY0_9AGAR|nr:hypothetical protein H0H81_012262 [Sphagnurus paluster]
MSTSHTLKPLAVLPGHTDRAWNIAWNPTRPLLASCSADKSVRIYAYTPNTPTPAFTPLSTIPTGHTKAVRALAWSPSGRTLATASFDSNIGIWEQEHAHDDMHDDNDDAMIGDGEWECVSQLEGHETECKSVAYSSTGTLLASCSRDKTVWVWEVHPDSDFECMGVLMDHTQDVKCVAWHPTQEVRSYTLLPPHPPTHPYLHTQVLASASYDDTIKLYIDDPQDDWFCFATLTGHTSTVWCIAFSPCGAYLASASDDRTVRVWQRVGAEEYRWECALVLEGHERSVYSLSWGVGVGAGTSPSTGTGKEKEKDENKHLGWLASTGGDGRILVWELSEGPTKPAHRLIARVEAAHGVYDVNAVAWCPRAGHTDLLATAGDDGATRVWKMDVL